MTALIQFLETLALLVALKNGGRENDVTRMLRLAAVGARAKANLKEALDEARAKVQELVDQDRSLTDEENAAIDASIAEKLARAAAVDLESDPPPAG